TSRRLAFRAAPASHLSSSSDFEYHIVHKVQRITNTPIVQIAKRICDPKLRRCLVRTRRRPFLASYKALIKTSTARIVQKRESCQLKLNALISARPNRLPSSASD